MLLLWELVCIKGSRPKLMRLSRSSSPLILFATYLIMKYGSGWAVCLFSQGSRRNYSGDFELTSNPQIHDFGTCGNQIRVKTRFVTQIILVCNQNHLQIPLLKDLKDLKAYLKELVLQPKPLLVLPCFHVSARTWMICDILRE